MKRRWPRVLAFFAFLWVAEFGLYLAEPAIAMRVQALRSTVHGPQFDPEAMGLTPAPGPEAAPAPRTPDTFRFVAAGHLQGLDPYPRLLDRLADCMNRESPDLVVLLGDYTVDGNRSQWRTMDRFLSRLQATVWATPGNREHARSWAVSADSCVARFHRRFDYDHRMEVRRQANLFLVDSNRPLAEISDRLIDDFPMAIPGKPTLLFTHHRIWENPRGSAWNDMPYRASEILSLLRGRVSDVIAGDFPADPAAGGHAVSYRTAELDGIRMHPVGLGDPGYGQPLVYAVGTVDGAGDVDITLRYIQLPEGDPWYSVRVEDAGEAFRALSLGRKLQLYARYLRHGEIPRGRVPRARPGPRTR